MFYYRLKNFICVTAACLFALICCVGIRYANVTKLSALEGERTYYLDSASSQGLRKDTLSVRDLYRVKGESVSFSMLDKEEGMCASKEDLAQSIADMYQAKILFIEEVCGIVSYYGYTPIWQDGILVEGKRINLHVAIGDEVCVVGTPIIFGGF